MNHLSTPQERPRPCTVPVRSTLFLLTLLVSQLYLSRSSINMTCAQSSETPKAQRVKRTLHISRKNSSHSVTLLFVFINFVLVAMANICVTYYSEQCNTKPEQIIMCRCHVRTNILNVYSDLRSLSAH